MGLYSKTDDKFTTPNILDMLFRNHNTSNKSFSLCLGTEGGFMTLGGYNKEKHLKRERV